MRPIEFYEKLKNTPLGHGGVDHPYNQGYIQIKEKGSPYKGVYYTLYANDNSQHPPVLKEGCGDYEWITIDQVPDGDYELYSEVQIIKSGWIEFPNVKNHVEVRKALSNFYIAIRSGLQADGEKQLTCGSSSWSYSSKYGESLLSGGFSFYFKSEIEVDLNTKSELQKEMRSMTRMGLPLYNYGGKLFKRSHLVGVRLISTITTMPEETLSVENQLEAIKFLTDNLPGSVFHDNYIRRWEYLLYS